MIRMISEAYDGRMTDAGTAPVVEPKGSGLLGGIASIAFALLELGVAYYTGDACAIGAGAMMMWVVPLVIGGGITLLFGSLSVTFAIFALVKNPRQYVAMLGVLLSVLSLGGCYAGCVHGLPR